MRWLLLILIFIIQAEVTGVISVGEHAATPAPTATSIPSASAAPIPDKAVDNREGNLGWIILFSIVILLIVHTKLQ